MCLRRGGGARAGASEYARHGEQSGDPAQDQGKYDEAEPLYRRALAGKEEALGPAHPDTLITVNNLANLLSEQGKYDEAEPMYRRALAGNEEALGPAHPNTLLHGGQSGDPVCSAGQVRRGGAAVSPRACGQGGGARAGAPGHAPHGGQLLLRVSRAIRACEDTLGGPARARAGAPGHARHGGHLANLYEQGGTTIGRRSRSSAVRSMAKEEALGPMHPYTLLTVNNLALLLKSIRASTTRRSRCTAARLREGGGARAGAPGYAEDGEESGVHVG